MDLKHYSTFEDINDFQTRAVNKKYQLAIKSPSKPLDDRTTWVNEYITACSESLWAVEYNTDSCCIEVNGKSFHALELAKKLQKPNLPLLIDSTSLSYPEIQYLFYWLNKINTPFELIYVEPQKYPTKKNDHHLSADGPGISHLGPFIGSTTTSDVINAISIGFEGHRVIGLLNNDQLREPGFHDVRVIVGVPAFKAGYDRVSLSKNIDALAEMSSMERCDVSFASANNPWAMYEELKTIRKSINAHPEKHPMINLVPFGTKPSAIGMAWFAVKNEDQTIVTYDHVIKLAGRTEGVGKIHLASFQ